MVRKGRDPDRILWHLLGAAIAVAGCWGIIYLLVTRGK